MNIPATSACLTKSRRLVLPILLGVAWFSSLGWLNAVAADDASTLADTQPLWKMGVSTFTGSGYELPPAPSQAPAPELPAADTAKPYTVPTQPGMTLPPAAAATLQNPYAAITNAISSAGEPAETTPTTATPPTSDGTPAQAAGYQSLADAPTLAAPIQNGGVTDEQIVDQITEQLSSAEIDTPPLQQEVVRWYQYPIRWMKGWDSNAEFGIDGSDGNAETLALQTGLELVRKTDAYTLSLDVDYRQASSRDVTVEDNGRLNLDYDRNLGDSPWTMFGKLGLEWDAFKAFDLRLNLNSGVGYNWIDTDKTTLITRFGAGASKEFGAPDDSWTPEAVFGIEAKRQLTSRQKIKGKLDYFPSWEDFSDYRLVADVSWEILLDGSDNLSLKLAANNRYDSTPQGFEPNDLYYSLLLLYKF